MVAFTLAEQEDPTLILDESSSLELAGINISNNVGARSKSRKQRRTGFARR